MRHDDKDSPQQNTYISFSDIFIHSKTMFDSPGVIYPRLCCFLFPPMLAHGSLVLQSRQVGSLFHNNNKNNNNNMASHDRLLHVTGRKWCCTITPSASWQSREKSRRKIQTPSNPKIWIPIRFKCMHTHKKCITKRNIHIQKVFQLPSEIGTHFPSFYLIGKITLSKKANTY